MGSFFTSVRDGQRLTITLEKPEQHNVVNPQEMTELSNHLNERAKEDGILVAILTGQGKSFCSGANLGEIKDYNFDNNPLETLSNSIENLPFPIICRLNGGVYGGGTDIALACDFRIGMEAMKCFIPPAKIGIHYHGTGMARAVSRLGLGPAKRFFLAADMMKGPELKEIGFLDYLVKDVAELDEKTAELSRTLAGLAPLSLRGMKATFNEIARQEFDNEASIKRQKVCLNSSDFAEGWSAVAEKRPAKFTGS